MDFLDPSGQGECRERARAFGAQEIARSVAARDRAMLWDPGSFARMGEAGLLGAVLPKDVGGGGLRAMDLCALLEGFTVGSEDLGLTQAWTAHMALAGVAIARFGSGSQQREHLPGLCTGSSVGAWAHHEACSGSNPVGIETRATRRGDHWVLAGKKTWVTNGPIASVFVITAMTDPALGKQGIAAFIVPRDTKGLSAGRRFETSALRTATFSEVELSGCEVAPAQLLAAEGEAFLRLLRFVQRWERASAVASLVGWAEALVHASVRAARETERFGRAIGTFGDVRAKLADMVLAHASCRRLALRSAWQLDQGDGAGDRDIAVAKVFVSDAAQRIVESALQIHGCTGLEHGTFVERAYRDAALLRHVGGNSAVLRSVIAGSLLEMG